MPVALRDGVLMLLTGTLPLDFSFFSVEETFRREDHILNNRF